MVHTEYPYVDGMELPDTSVREGDEDGTDGHWITLRSGGGLVSHVFVNPHGVITKGPSQLTGHAVGHLPPAPHVEQEHHAGGEEPQGARDQANYSAERVGGATQPWKGAALAGAHVALAGAHNATAVARREQDAKEEAHGGYWGTVHLRGERHDQIGVFLNKKGTITKGPESLVGANIWDLDAVDRLAGHPGATLSAEDEPEQPSGMTEHPTYVDKHDEIGQGAATKSAPEALLGLERAVYEQQRSQGVLKDSPLHDRQTFERRLGQVYGLDTTDEAAKAGARTPVEAATSSVLAHQTQDVDAAEQARGAGARDPAVATKQAVMKDIGGRLAASLPAQDARWAIQEIRGQNPDHFTAEHAEHPQRYHFGLARALTDMWALSSSDTHAAPLATQLIAAEHFGISSWDQHDENHPPPTCADPKEWQAARALAQNPRYQRCVKAYVGAMYQNTQERLRAHGVTQLALCRGTQDYAPDHLLTPSVDAANAQIDRVLARGSDDQTEASQWVAGGTVDTTLNPLSSFSTNAEVASRDDFGGATSLAQLQEGKANIHYVGAVPAERVLSLYSTGLGCRNEHEAVVLGGPAQMQWVAAGTHDLAHSWLERMQHGGRQPGVQPTVAGQAHNPHPEVQQQIDRLDRHGVKVTDNMPAHYTPVQKAQALHNVANAVDLMHQHFPQLAQANQRHGMEYTFDGPQRTQNADGSYDVTMGAYDDSSAQPKIHINEGAEQTLWHEAGHYLDHALKGRTQDRTPGAVNFASEDPDHHFNALAEHLKTTDAHQDMLRNDPAIQRHLGGHGDQEDADRHAYRTDNREVLARFFNGYMHHQAQKAGLPINEAPSRGDEHYSPEELEHYGSYLRDNLPQQVQEALDELLSPSAPQQTEPVNLDATIQNADWLKRTWDLQGEAKDQLQTIVGNAATLGERRQRVRQFLQTPAAFAMPPKLRQLLAARGYLPQEAREADADAGGHWVTMHLGPMRTHVFINERGVITKGPASLTGHSMDHLPNKIASKEHHPWGHEPPGAQQHPDYSDVSGTLGQQGHAPQPYNEGVQHLMQALTTAPPPTEPTMPGPSTAPSAVPEPPVVQPAANALATSAAQSVISPDLSWHDGIATRTVQEEEYNDVPQTGDPAIETKVRVMTDLGRRMAAGVSVDDCKEIMQEFGYDPDEMPAGLRGHPHRYHFGAARALTERWAVSSSDTHADALAIQVLADQHFGIGAFAGYADPETPPAVCQDPQAWRHALYYTSHGPFQRAVTGFLDAMYQHTQEHLQKKGITHLALCRGTVAWATPEQVQTCKRNAEAHWNTMDYEVEGEGNWTAGGTADVDLHPLSSFSTKAAIAADFGGYTSPGQLSDEDSANIHYVGKVPAARILSLFTTGFGCREELEAVVLGGPTRMHWAAGGIDWLVQRKLEQMQQGAAPWESVQEAEMTPGTRLHLDATIANADWTKKAWDLHGTPEEQVRAIVGRARTDAERRALVAAFLRTPAAQTMPADVRAALQAAGAPASDGGQAPSEPNADVHEADKPQDDDPTGRWVTLHGSAVFITHDGTIKKGPPLLKGIKLPPGTHKKVLDEHDKAEAAKKAQQGQPPSAGQPTALPADTGQLGGKQTKFGKPTKFGKAQGQQGTTPPSDPSKTWGQPDKYGQYPGADMPTWAAGLTKAPDVPPVPPPQLPKNLPAALLEPAETPGGPGWAQRIDLDKLGMMKEVGQAGGQNGARFYEDSQGQRYVTKRPQADRLAMEQYGVAYMHQLGMQAPAAVINPQWRGGMLVQRMVTNLADPPDMKNWTADDFAKNLSTEQATEMARNFIVDWVLGNGDAHRRNFLLTKDGGLVGIDKGQAFKYAGDPRYKMHEPYVSPQGEVSFPHGGIPAPNGHASLPPWTGSKEGLAYAGLFTAIKQGKLKVDMKALGAFVDKVESTPFDEQALRTIATLRHQAHWDKFPKPDAFVQIMAQRRAGVRGAMQHFFQAVGVDASALQKKKA